MLSVREYGISSWMTPFMYLSFQSSSGRFPGGSLFCLELTSSYLLLCLFGCTRALPRTTLWDLSPSSGRFPGGSLFCLEVTSSHLLLCLFGCTRALPRTTLWDLSSSSLLASLEVPDLVSPPFPSSHATDSPDWTYRCDVVLLVFITSL